MIGGQQQMADGGRDPNDDKGDQIAQDRPAKDRIPREGEEGADAAEGEGCDLPKRKGEAHSDDTQAIVDGLHRVPVDAAASPP